jgi:hypothetical protein
MKRLFVLFIALLLSGFTLFSQEQVEKWSAFELVLKGPETGNPFTEVMLKGTFLNGEDRITVRGFYDGDGTFKIRFIPGKEGRWDFFTVSNAEALDGKKGAFTCIAAREGNHGQVVVKDTFGFAYDDGTPYLPFGTTCYAWVHQGDSLADLTLQTLRQGYFNKMRMCIFPKSYDWNHNEPGLYPYEGSPLHNWDFSRFNPGFFRNIEKRIRQLDAMGIEADLIVFHPYDRWGFSNMTEEDNERYIQYIIARFAAYKNVWWSMANEFDFIGSKNLEDWDGYIRYFAENDPFHHLRSIHNGAIWYDHTNPLITHASIQNEETFRAKDLRTRYQKPVVFDECRYEGNVPWSWGNLTPQSMTEKFWRGFLNGGFVGHGETYVTEDPIRFPGQSEDVLWWSKGGKLIGQSPERIKFLRQILESAPPAVHPVPLMASWMPFPTLGIEGAYYLTYFNDAQPRSTVVDLPGDASFTVEVIDTWNMTIRPLEGSYSGRSLIELPGKPYMALRIVRR